ncbi:MULTISPECIES: excisionase family DNA-binding protein [Corynebacterium]|uniref:excisionase family DNA-binding protein n=1 Tax=Corynebacterium TaxID=1716 RepID=UPI000EDA17EE|nr:excisionase family DNA-binding protein [Corynebacterium testudinoris]MBX8996880.1 helix-turn-helix domain-containing protein [Corynebacterium testudinoris]TVS22067.1 helix-turn-helix domain-containing protein [Corynebacterium sanguinis]TVS23759.1 helix-turn-helix domain-containing protein [Corynebacterium sanguinis]HCG46495.1 DNA-binding protein [Corynebacterium flavescens]
MPIDTWLTTEEAANYLRCSPTHVRRALRRGDLRGVLFGKTYRIRREWADSYMEGMAA